MTAIATITEWLQELLGVESSTLNRRESQALLANETEPEHLQEQQRVTTDGTGLTLIRQRVGLVGILKKNLNAPRPSEHPPVRGKKMSKHLGGINS